jgi:hypothetical protein
MLRDALRLCLDRRVIASLAAIGLAVALLAPDRLLAVVPLLIVLACPASMIVMAWTMRPSRTPAGELGEARRRGHPRGAGPARGPALRAPGALRLSWARIGRAVLEPPRPAEIASR